MQNNSWINDEKVKYFDLEDYIEKIKVNSKILSVAEETAEMFEQYLGYLNQYYLNNLDGIVREWLDAGLKEQKYSNKIESHVITNEALSHADLFFEKTTINHERIKRIHKFVCEYGETQSSIVGEYRKDEVNVGTTMGDGKYVVYWYGVQPEDIKKFMDSFINFYRTNSIQDLYNNPFLKSAMAHLLLVRIHPFGDGNGRTSRIIQNIAFTNGINRIYDTKLKLSPINISQAILQTRYEYADIINRVRFNLDYDNNEIINRWLLYILYKYQEQMYFQTNRFGLIDDYIKNHDDIIGDSAEKMKLKNLIRP